MNISLSNVVSASDIQKNYRKIFDRVKRTKEPVVVMRGKKPEVAVVSIKELEEMEKLRYETEVADALKAIEIGEKELKEGKLKLLRGSLVDLAKKARRSAK
jgi:prevent-host-death family protein